MAGSGARNQRPLGTVPRSGVALRERCGWALAWACAAIPVDAETEQSAVSGWNLREQSNARRLAFARYSIVFGVGVFGWSFLLPRIQIRLAMRICLLAMLPVCLGLLAINHSTNMAPAVRWLVIGVTALLIMIESGSTPAALAWLAQSLGVGTGKGAAMGLYSVLLSLGAIGGSLLAALWASSLQSMACCWAR